MTKKTEPARELFGPEDTCGLRLARRAFLKALSGLTIAGTAGCVTVAAPECDAASDPIRFQLTRAADRLYFELEAYGFCVKRRGSEQYLVPRKQATHRRLVLTFQSQHFTESAIPIERVIPTRVTGSQLDQIGLVPSGPSRLIFDIPDAIQRIELSVGSLLDWSQWQLILPDLQRLATESTPEEARRNFIGFNWFTDPKRAGESVIELPWGVYLQPLGAYLKDFVWAHARSPIVHHGRTQLWFAALQSPRGANYPLAFEVLDVKGLRRDGNPGDQGTRYVDADDYVEVRDVVECSPTTNFDRLEIAGSLSRRFTYNGSPVTTPANRLTYAQEGGDSKTGACYVPGRTVNVLMFGVSALGGWLDIESEWTAKPGCQLKAWTHHASFGRDHYVKYERAGFLYPFGIPAELVILSEREFVQDDEDHFVAPLMKQAFIQVPQPNGLDINHPESPFRTLGITTIRTPPLDIPKYKDANTGEIRDGNLIDYAESDYFLPKVGGQPFAFEHTGIDHSGATVTSRTPLYFVSNKATGDDGLIPESRRTVSKIPQAPLLKKIQVSPVSAIRATVNGTCAMSDPAHKLLDCYTFEPESGGLRALDRLWQQQPYRFALYARTPIAIAPSFQAGDTTNDVEWIEWVRGQLPKSGKEGFAPQPFLPRARTLKVALPSMRQFSGQPTFMLGTYRDLRGGVECWLDPEPNLNDGLYGANLLRPDAKSNEFGAYLHILPLDPVDASDANHYPFAPEATTRETKIRNIYFGTSLRGAEHPLPQTLFNNLQNEISFGRRNSSESLGAISTPDAPVGLLTRSQGPLGDAVVDPKRWHEASPQDRFSIPASRIDYVFYRLNYRNRQNNALVYPFEVPLDAEIYAPCKTLVELYPDRTKAAIQPRMPAAAAAPGLPGVADISSMFGTEAEILPGIRLSRVLEGVLRPATRLSDNGDPGESSAPRWDYRVTGIDAFLALFGTGEGQIDPADVAALAASSDSPEEPVEPLNFGVEASLTWETRSIRGLDLGFMAFVPKDSVFSIQASTRMALGDSKPALSASASLTDFRIVALKSLDIAFIGVSFELDADGHRTFSPQIGEVQFTGPLAFINNLKKLLKGLEDQFGIILSITPQQIEVSQKIMIPPGNGTQPAGTLQLGPALITNLNFNWGVRIPLLGRSAMSVAFGVATREDPLTIFIPPFYGGKAHALMEVTTRGVRLFEVSMEYGGLILVQYSIASGEVSVMAGLFFQVATNESTDEQEFTLIAYVRITGTLDVAHIITFQGLILVSLTYEKGSESGSKIAGEASVTVSMKIGFVRISYSFTARHVETRRDDNSQRVSRLRERNRPVVVSAATAFDHSSGGSEASWLLPVRDSGVAQPPGIASNRVDDCEATFGDSEQIYLFRCDPLNAAWRGFVRAYAR